MRALLLVALLGAACAPEAAPGVDSDSPEGGGVAATAPTPRTTAPTPVPPDPGVPDPGAAATDPPSDGVTSWLDRYDFDDRHWYVDLPGRLDEVSGLAFTEDGRLFAHDDERGRIHEIDPETGAVGKRFDLGDPMVRDDLEGIAIVGDRFFVVSSTGLLYEFREGDDGADVEYRVTDSGVGPSCEVEGLEYDPSVDALLLACKTTAPARGPIEVRRLAIEPGTQLQAIVVDRSPLAALDIDTDFAPSGIVRTPLGTLLVLSARDDAILEIDASGRILSSVALRGGRHPQSEGIALAADGTLYVADEKNGKEPRLTAYTPSEVDGGAE